MLARSASSPRQGNRAPWTAREDSSPRTRSAGTRRPSFSCISCISWFQPFAALKHLAWLPCTYPRQHATTATLHAVGPQLSVCGTTKYTKTRGHKPKARDAASGVSCPDVPRLTPRGHPAYKRSRPRRRRDAEVGGVPGSCLRVSAALREIHLQPLGMVVGRVPSRGGKDAAPPSGRVATASCRGSMLGKRLEAASTFTRPSWRVAAASCRWT